jgi:hypothetical protein
MLLNWKNDVMGYTARVRLQKRDSPASAASKGHVIIIRERPLQATCRVHLGLIEMEILKSSGEATLDAESEELMADNVHAGFRSDRDRMVQFERWVSRCVSTGGYWVSEEKL